jgi:hypothetical protein
MTKIAFITLIPDLGMNLDVFLHEKPVTLRGCAR